MFERILFCVDFSPYTQKILACAGELAGMGVRNAVLLHVQEPRDRHEIEELETLAQGVRGGGLAVKSMMVEGAPGEKILQVAREEDVSLIYLGGHGRGFTGRVLLGSVTRHVLKQADRSVLVHKCRTREEVDGYSCDNVCELLFENVLVAADFSRSAKPGAPWLEEFLKSCCPRLTLLHVQEEGEIWGLDAATLEGEKVAAQHLESLKELTACLEPHCEYIETRSVMGNPASSMMQVAREMRASLLIIGPFSHREGMEWLLGGTAEAVVRASDIPVLIMRGSGD